MYSGDLYSMSVLLTLRTGRPKTASTSARVLLPGVSPLYEVWPKQITQARTVMRLAQLTLFIKHLLNMFMGTWHGLLSGQRQRLAAAKVDDDFRACERSVVLPLRRASNCHAQRSGTGSNNPDVTLKIWKKIFR